MNVRRQPKMRSDVGVLLVLAVLLGVAMVVAGVIGMIP